MRTANVTSLNWALRASATEIRRAKQLPRWTLTPLKFSWPRPNEVAALKLLFLAIRQAAKKWTMPVKNWSEALNYFTVLWPERMGRSR